MDTNPDPTIAELDPTSRGPDPTSRELDHRFNDGIDVTLRWNERTGTVSIAVQDEKTSEFFELEADPEDALTAFHHPYAYASRGRTEPPIAA